MKQPGNISLWKRDKPILGDKQLEEIRDYSKIAMGIRVVVVVVIAVVVVKPKVVDVLMGPSTGPPVASSAEFQAIFSS